MSTPKKITLQSSDNEKFEVDESVVTESQTIKLLIDDGCAGNVIPLPNVSSKMLEMILEYCRKHVEAAAVARKGKKIASESSEDSLKKWDAEFVKLDQNTLRELLLAANYLNVKSLLDLICRTVANMIKGRTPEEVREIFDLKNDFTPEQEAAARKQVEWAGL